jgi:hypothetical protein
MFKRTTWMYSKSDQPKHNKQNGKYTERTKYTTGHLETCNSILLVLVGFPSDLDEDFGANSNFDWTNKSESSDNDDVDDDEMDSNFGTNSYDNVDDDFGT